MQLNRLAKVNTLDIEREGLKRDLVALAEDDYAMTIRGNRQDEAMLSLIRPVLQAEIRARIRVIERELAHMGVEVGDA